MRSKKYLRFYYKIINKAFLEDRNYTDGIYERHHVKPNCFNGSRLVLLTAKEHYIAHFLLYKHYKHNNNKPKMIKMLHAFNIMCTSSNDNIIRYTSKTFEIARTARRELIRGENHPFYGKKHSVKSREKIKKSLKNMDEDKRLNMKLKQRKAKIGTTIPTEVKLKMLKSRELFIENKPKIYHMIFKDGTEEYASTFNYFVKKYNLSKSMLGRSINKGIITYGDKQSKIRTTQTENTIGLIFNKTIDIIK